MFITNPFTADNLGNGSVMNVVCYEQVSFERSPRYDYTRSD